MQFFFYYIKLNLNHVHIDGQDFTSPDAKDTWAHVYLAKISSASLEASMPPCKPPR
jgi:hypothetical protein